MNKSTVSVPIPTKQFVEIIEFLKINSLDRDPVEIVHQAIEYWIDNASWKKEEFFGLEVRGFWWKKLFVPHGSSARLIYKGSVFVAEVVEDGLSYLGKTWSPSEFVHEVTHTSRNAWRDIEFRFPDSDTWQLADDLRKRL